MGLFDLPSAEDLDRIGETWEKECGGAHYKEQLFLGVKIVSGPVHPFDALKLGAGKSVVIPDRPAFWQKIVAFLIVQVMAAEFIRKENQFIGYAYRWNNARDVFGW